MVTFGVSSPVVSVVTWSFGSTCPYSSFRPAVTVTRRVAAGGRSTGTCAQSTRSSSFRPFAHAIGSGGSIRTCARRSL